MPRNHRSREARTASRGLPQLLHRARLMRPCLRGFRAVQVRQTRLGSVQGHFTHDTRVEPSESRRTTQGVVRYQGRLSRKQTETASVLRPAPGLSWPADAWGRTAPGDCRLHVAAGRCHSSLAAPPPVSFSCWAPRGSSARRWAGGPRVTSETRQRGVSRPSAPEPCGPVARLVLLE